MNIFCKSDFWYAIAAIATAFIIYFLNKNTRGNKKYILKLFKANQILSLNTQNLIEEFIHKFNAYDAIAFPEKQLNYGHYLEQMKAEFENNLSDKVYNKLKKTKFTKPLIDSTIDSLNKQNESLRLIEIDIKIVIKQASSKQ